MTSQEIGDKAANAEERWLREIAFQLAILNEANQYKEHAQRLLDENTELRNKVRELESLRLADPGVIEDAGGQRGELLEHEWSGMERADVQYCLRCGRSREYAEGDECWPIRSVAELVRTQKDAGDQRGEAGEVTFAAKFPHEWVGDIVEFQYCGKCGHHRKYVWLDPCAALVRQVTAAIPNEPGRVEYHRPVNPKPEPGSSTEKA